MSKPLWKDQELNFPVGEFVPAEHYDAVIVGAGFTGLISSLLLAREGKRTLTVEARDIGAGASGATTAKATLLQGGRLSEIDKTFDQELASAYLESHQYGLAWLTNFCNKHDVPTQRQSAWTYAATPDGVDAIKKEHELAGRLGLPVRLYDTITAPFAVHGAVELPDQIQLNPVDLLRELSRAVTETGGTIVDRCRVKDVSSGDDENQVRVETVQGIVTADQVVLATATPILDKGRTTVQLHAERSYLCSFEYDGDVPDGMLISIESPTRSIRTAIVNDTRYLLVGGNGHRTGQSESTQAQLDEIVEWTAQHFPGARLTHSWSAQDYHPIGKTPVVTSLPWGNGRVHFAGGYSKWGLTGIPAAAQQVTDLALGKPELLSFGDPGMWGRFKSAVQTMSEAVPPVVKAVRDAVRTDLDDETGTATEDDLSKTGHVGRRPIGETTIDGQPCRVSLICPHMEAVLAWNDAEESWDCPLHGSRFEADGTLLEGPAATDLDRLR